MPLFKQLITLSLITYLAACTDQQHQSSNTANTEQDTAQSAPPTSPIQKPSELDQLNDDSVFSTLKETIAGLKAPKLGKTTFASIPREQVAKRASAQMQLYAARTNTLERENYQHLTENGVHLVTEHPVSTFSIDVDTASYSNIRRMLNREGRLPPRDAVKPEEMINYFSYNYTPPESPEQPFSVTTELAPAPWNHDHQLLQIGLKGFEPPRSRRPDANLVFLVDVSGSMRAQDKLGLLKKSLRLLVNQMHARDRIAIVVYAGAAGLVLDSTHADQKAKILSAIDSLEAGGSTNGGAGIRLAYAVAQQYLIKQGINRIIIASDGDMNVGTVDIHALKNLIEEKRKSGISLTTLGFGAGNYNEALMEQLADVGNGNAAYIDSLKEAHKVLVKEMQSTLLTIANDVKIQIEFNPALVAQYRLIGYENRLLNREDFLNDKVDAGDIGAGHTVTALYELTLVDSKTSLIAPKRYANDKPSKARPNNTSASNEIAFVKLRYKKSVSSKSIEISTPILQTQVQKNLDKATNNLRFASAVAGFAQLLKGGKFTQDWNFNDVLALARSAKGDDQHGYRAELISLVELAKSLSTQES
ncbi:VWA domain-containing protein [bacterium AH-315-K03]|nr:VWA domain-containing protein [bacterium AH-315-K03]